ncbi:MAG TPA: Holliday junction branch migration protein RuvA [Syntrophus sp. (in: bacteria)]|jgi:Holliday junction DNA helicase RuvA|nr:Holliday junction branch migration protein RuvA [Syntrophus sp. (in: bacteria)]
MIARISGTLVYKSVQAITLDAHGIGYRVFVPLTTFYELPEMGQPITLHIHTHVKEDAINLFGFHTLEERNMFQVMISVSGIGPRLAMNILSGINVEDLVDAITGGNLRRLLNIPGVGRKMAERLVLELKDKVLKLDRGQTAPRDRVIPRSPEEAVKEDALSALINLGYKNATARDVIEKIMKETNDIPALDLLLKSALQHLSG